MCPYRRLITNIGHVSFGYRSPLLDYVPGGKNPGGAGSLAEAACPPKRPPTFWKAGNTQRKKQPGLPLPITLPKTE